MLDEQRNKLSNPKQNNLHMGCPQIPAKSLTFRGVTWKPPSISPKKLKTSGDGWEPFVRSPFLRVEGTGLHQQKVLVTHVAMRQNPNRFAPSEHQPLQPLK